MSNTEATLTVIPAELVEAVNKTGLTPEGAVTLRDSFAPHFVEFHRLAPAAALIAVNQPKAARAMRLELRAVRIAAEKTRVELKSESLRRGKAVDSVNAILDLQIEPLETALEKIERAEEIAEAERQAKLVAERTQALAAYGNSGQFYDLGRMPAADFESLLAGLKAQYEKALADAAKVAAEAVAAEAARIEREAAAARAQELVRQENERLHAEAVERERVAKIERDRLKAIADAAEAKAKAAREAHAKALREAAQKAEAEAQESRKKAAAEMAALQAERDRLHREGVARAAAEAARVKAEKAAARKAANAPDADKLAALARAIRALKPSGVFLLPLNADAQVEVVTEIEGAAARIDRIAAEL